TWASLFLFGLAVRWVRDKDVGGFIHRDRGTTSDCADACPLVPDIQIACGQSQSRNAVSQFTPQSRPSMAAGEKSRRDGNDRTAVQRRSGTRRNRSTRRELQGYPAKIRTRARGIFCDDAGKCPIRIRAPARLVVGACIRGVTAQVVVVVIIHPKARSV